MNAFIIYKTKDEESIKKVYQLLMFQNDLNNAVVLEKMNNDSAVIEKQAQWDQELKEKIIELDKAKEPPIEGEIIP